MPLRIIQPSAEILEDSLDQLEPAERKERLQSIRINTRRVASLMEEALLLEAGKMEVKPASLELVRSCEDSWTKCFTVRCSAFGGAVA